MRTQRAPRRGAAALAAVVIMAVLAAMMAETTRQSVWARWQLDRRECLLQTRRWAESGVELAVAGLRADPAYKGETLAVTDGDIVIVVTPGDGQFQVRSTARYSWRTAGPIPVTVERTVRRGG